MLPFYTIPVTADNEQANSTLKLVKGYLRTARTTEILSSLVPMNIHHEKPVDHVAVASEICCTTNSETVAHYSSF